jgi:hypothetical protein
MRQRKTVRDKIEARIARKQGEAAFLTREFRDLGDADQVARALRRLVRDKRLVRLGYGVYGRAFISKFTGDAVLDASGGFIDAARQALTKLGVPWEITRAECDYNERRSTQVPANAVVIVKGPFSRRLHHGKFDLIVLRQDY